MTRRTSGSMTDRSAELVLAPEVSVLPASPAAYGVLRLGRDCGEDVMARMDAALGSPLPRAPNTAAGAHPRLLWTAPLEWTVLDATPAHAESPQAACRHRPSAHAE